MSNLSISVNKLIPFEQCNFELIEVKECQHPVYRDFVVETNHKVMEWRVALLLGISHEYCTQYIGGKQNYTSCEIQIGESRWFQGRFGYMHGITLEQYNILCSKANNSRANYYKPILDKLMTKKILPLFNQQPTLDLVVNDEVKDISVSAQVSSTKIKTMSSVEIAELTGKLHAHIMRDIRSMIEQLEASQEDDPNLDRPKLRWYCESSVYTNNQNKPQPCFILDYNTTINLLTGYDAAKRMAVIQRWQELENKITDPQVEYTHQQIIHTTKSIGNASLMKLALKEVECMDIGADRKQALKAHILHEQVGLPIELMLTANSAPKIRAGEIAQAIGNGCTPQKVSWIIRKLGIKADASLVEKRVEKAALSSNEIARYYYDPSVIEQVKAKLKEISAS